MFKYSAPLTFASEQRICCATGNSRTARKGNSLHSSRNAFQLEDGKHFRSFRLAFLTLNKNTP